ncbi:MAG: hypothetical protein WCG81_15390 [Candidatus Angelobacter sp.]
MKKSHCIAAALLVFLTCAVAQTDNASAAGEPQPSDLHYEIAIKDGRTLFHLGEAIEIEEIYSADVTMKYLLLGLPQQVMGHPAQVTIKPASGVTDRIQDNGRRSADSILRSNCLYGYGTGIGSGCGDCDSRRPLSPSPTKLSLNITRQFQITRPGHYLIQTKAANVVRAPMQASAPITLTSNTLEIDVIEDLQWSAEALAFAIEQFDKAQAKYIFHRWGKLPMSQMGAAGIGERQNLEAEMQKAAEKMKLLDTEESLAEIIRRYDGANISWDYYRYILYDGIIQSKHSSLAIDLLSERMFQPDFWVSEQVIDQLTAMKLQREFPIALDSEEASYQKQFYPAARRILHDYVLAVGKSLAEKDSNAYAPSLNVFNFYARQDYCTGKPLISKIEMQEIEQQIGTYQESSTLGGRRIPRLRQKHL